MSSPGRATWEGSFDPVYVELGKHAQGPPTLGRTPDNCTNIHDLAHLANIIPANFWALVIIADHLARFLEGLGRGRENGRFCRDPRYPR